MNRNKITRIAKFVFKFKLNTELHPDSPVIKLINSSSKKYVLKINENELVIYGVFDRISLFIEIFEVNKKMYDIESASIECYNFEEDLFVEIFNLGKTITNIEDEEKEKIKLRYNQLKELRRMYKEYYEENRPGIYNNNNNINNNNM